MSPCQRDCDQGMHMLNDGRDCTCACHTPTGDLTAIDGFLVDGFPEDA
jgi:hypothetical protein